MWAVVTIGRVMEPDGLVRNADIVGESSMRRMVDPSRPIKINRYLRRKKVDCGCIS